MRKTNFLFTFVMLFFAFNLFSQSDNNWLKDFDGKVDGEVYDVIKSAADQKVYFCGGFLSANSNSDMKNITRWNPTSKDWEQLPGINSGHSNFIRCMTQDEAGNLYVGGDFSSIGGVPAGRVAKFEVATAKWISLKDENYFEEEQMRGPTSGGVYSIAMYNNILYIGGHTFNSAGDTWETYKYKYIRTYNLQTKTWGKLGEGINGKVSAIAIDNNGNIYAGGVFTKADNTTVSNIAMWNGTNWVALAGGVDGEIIAMQFYNNKLYVAGSFTKLNGTINCAGVGIWNGNSWEAMNAGLKRTSGTVYVQDIDIDATGKVYVGGFFDARASDNTPLNNCAYFNGTDWLPLGSGLGRSSTQGVNAVFADGNDIYFAGYFANPVGSVTTHINQALWNANTDFTQDVVPQVSINTYEVATTSNSPFTATIKFSEVITGFELADIQVTNASLSYLSNTVTEKKWTVKVTPTSVGAVTLKIPANAVVDASNKQNTASNNYSIIYSLPNQDDNHWLTEFDGIIEGEIYDICKSSADGKIYFSGGFLSVNGNTDMKNFVRYNTAGNVWEQVEGIDYTQDNFFRCMVTDENGDIYIGGDFSNINGVKCNKVAKFEVATGTWKSLLDKTFFEETQMRGPNSGGVYAIEKLGNYIYIGGYTFNSSNSEYLYIRRYDIINKKWEAVAGGVDYKISAFAKDNLGNLYAAGAFTSAGGVAVNNIAKFNGTSWQALGEGTNAAVYALEWANGKLYVAGDFSHVDGNIRSQGIAVWNGTNWESMDKGIDNSEISYSVQDVAVDSDGKVYIGGYFDMRFYDDQKINHVAVYDGTHWTPLGTGLGTSSTQGINAVFADGKNVYFGGMFSKDGLLNQAIWNDTKDFTQSSNPGVYIYDDETKPVMKESYQIIINFSQTVNNFVESDILITNATITKFENLYSNKRFRITVTPTASGLITVKVPANVCTNDANLQNVVSNTYQNTYYQGSKNWFFDFDGTVEGEIYDIVHSKVDNKIYVCGGFLSVNGNTDFKNIARWNPRNNTWEQIPGIDYTHENFIRCMVQDEIGNLYIGGDFSSIAGLPTGRVAKFNIETQTWESLKDDNFLPEEQVRGPESGGVYAIAYSQNYVYIGGHVFNSTDPALLYIRRYNTINKTWESVGQGVDAKVSALTTDDAGNIFAAGIFTKAGNTDANNIAKWNGNSWEALAEGTNAAVYDIKFYNGNIYVAGAFTKVGNNIRSQGIAKWNGNSWEAMGEGIDNSGISPSVYGIAIAENGKIYIGGFFDTRFSDDKKINHVAVFQDNDWQPLEYGLANSSTQGINTVYALGNDIYFGGAFTRPIVNGLLNHAIWNENTDFTQDNKPAVSFTTEETKFTANKSFNVTVKFTEEVTDFQKTDITVENGGIIKLTQQVDTRIYIAEVTPLDDGEVKIYMLADKVKDINNNFNIESDILSIHYDSDLAGLDKNWFFDFDGKIEGEVFDICKSSKDEKIYFVGGFLSVNGNSNMKNMVRYIPTSNTWEQVEGIDAYHYNFIRCMVQDANGDLYVGGDFSNIGDVSVGRVAKFSVQTGEWSALEDVNFFETSQKKGPNSGGVYAITISGDYVYIGGHTFNSTNSAYLYIRRFNIVNKTWEAVGSGLDAKVSALTTDAQGNVYAGGIFTKSGELTVNNIAKWNGSSWENLGEGTNGQVLEIACYQNNVYAAGIFTKSGNNVKSKCVAMYDGINWNKMGEGIDNSSITPSVYGLTIDADGKVYIAGYFDIRYSDDAKINHCAVYQDNDWQALGNGIAQSSTQGANVLYADGNNIYAGGMFSRPTGGTQNTAIWNKNVDFSADLIPSVKIYSFDNPTTNNNPVEIIIEFSEIVNGFETNDITIENATISEMTPIIEKTKFKVKIIPDKDGNITLNIDANKVTDATGNYNTAATEFSINYTQVNSIDNINNDFYIYPNPCADWLNIVSQKQIADFEIKIFSLQGELIFKNKNVKTVNINNFAVGIYIIEINDGKNVYVSKFVKQN